MFYFVLINYCESHLNENIQRSNREKNECSGSTSRTLVITLSVYFYIHKSKIIKLLLKLYYLRKLCMKIKIKVFSATIFRTIANMTCN